MVQPILIKMEVFRPDKFEADLYRATIVQSGAGDIDRYIYRQDGEGIGSFFGNIFRTVAPLFGKAIKGAARIAKPHLQRAATDLVTAGGKRVLDKISSNNQRTPNPRRKAKRRRTVRVTHTRNIDQ